MTWYRANLSPSVTVDKNGTLRTVYRRVEPTSRSFSAPSAKPLNPERGKFIAASAALLLITSRVPEPGDRRAELIRDIVNLGMEDNEAVEFLSLVFMPLELLDETAEFLAKHESGSNKDSERHRQSFFSFANDAYFEMPPEQATTMVTNAIRVHPDESRFTDHSRERLEALSDHGIDCREPMDEDMVQTAKALVSVTVAAGRVPYEEAKDVFHGFKTMNTKGEHEYFSIKDEKLVELIVESGPRYKELLAVIKERRTLDVDFLRSVLESPAPSVKEGIL